jgi:urea transporter
MKMREDLLVLARGSLNSYSQVFFARNSAFASFLLIVTFIDPFMGLCGFFSILISNLFAMILGFSREAIAAGDYGFNSLLVGLGLGFYYAPNFELMILLVVGAMISFLFTVLISGILYKYGLPFLSVPFLLALWALMLSSRNFTTLDISERGIYTLNELYATGSNLLVTIYQRLNRDFLPEMIRIYFNSLGAILFQFNILSGIIVAIGLLIYSRIAFLYSLISFAAAYYFYHLLGADITTLSYNYIGFNFILSGIALGGYFLVPSKTSMLWTVLLVPMLMILTSSLGSLFAIVQLNIYSLPFNIVVITFLYVLKLRQKPGKPAEVVVQHFAPENNLYHAISSKGRFENFRPVAISLPVFGNWHISQAHDGRHTHRGEWKHAWDFVITDEQGRQHKDTGQRAEDYYCFGKPVIAPADGEIEAVFDEVEDNLIGDSNLAENWGNSIVIKHGYQLYTQISHLKKHSIKVKIGDKVKKGDVLAACGNSGRSPEPHVHFQIQATPFIGSKTVHYPLSHFIVQRNGKLNYQFFSFPDEGDVVRKIESSPAIYHAFHFLPGQVLTFEAHEDDKTWKESWEVKTDFYNNSYLECNRTHAVAYFHNDGILFYFTQFKGSKRSLLYSFYLAAYRVLLSDETNLDINDEVPLHLYTSSMTRYLNDFIAPAHSLMKARYRMSYGAGKKSIGDESLVLRSQTRLLSMGRTGKKHEFVLRIQNYAIEQIEVAMNNSKRKVICIKI